MANPNTGIHATTTRGFERPGAIGQVADNSPHNVRRDLINKNPQAVQVGTFVFATTAEADYDFNAGGIDFNLAASAASLAAAADAFETSWNADPILRGWMVAESDGVDTVTVTGILPGLVIDITESEANMTYTTTQAAADADPVEFGRALVGTGYATPSDAQLDPDGTMLAGVKAAKAAFTAQSTTFTVADPGGDELLVGVKIPGVGEVAVLVNYNTDLDTTLDDAATLINAALADLPQAPGSSAFASALVAAAGPTATTNPGELAFAASLAGVEFEPYVTSSDAAGYPAITVSDNRGPATSFLQSFAGVSIRATDEVPSQVGTTVSTYGANRGVRRLADGPIWVESSESPAWGDRAFVGLGSGEEGQWFKSAGTDRLPVPLPVARWLYSARSGEGDDAAVLRVLASV